MSVRVVLLLLAWGGVLGRCNEQACLSFSSQGPLCRICNPSLGFYSSGDGECLHSTIEGCEMYTLSGGCQRCAAGYVLVGCGCRMNTMRPMIANCAAYSADARLCVSCGTGFYVTGTGGCAAVTSAVANCMTHSSASACGVCNSGFTLIGGACVANPGFCMISTGVSCLQCLNGYVLTQSNPSSDLFNLVGPWWLTQGSVGPSGPSFTCAPQATNCATFLTPTTCLTCLSGFYLSGNACLPVTGQIANCVIYASATTCAQCASGYYPASATSCMAVTTSIVNCIAHTSPTVCVRCVSGYFLQNNLCLESTVITNCAIYSGNGVCRYCNLGYIIQNNQCLEVQNFVANCAVMTLNSCWQCINDYYLTSNGQCLPVPMSSRVANCARYESQTLCRNCLTGYFLENNVCRGFTVAVNCFVLNPAGGCRWCSSGFYAVNGACVAIMATITNCRFYASATTCAECASGFILNSGQTACAVGAIENCDVFTTATECLSCVNSYWLNTAIRQCVATTSVLNCATYVSATQCARCLPSFSLRGNVCVGLAVPLNNCEVAAFVGEGPTCLFCATLFALDLITGQCNPIDTMLAIGNCRYYRNLPGGGVECLQCLQNNYLSGGQCFPSLSYLSFCDNQDFLGNCIRCTNGHYMLAMNLCFEVDPGSLVPQCFEYNSSSVCTLCNSGYSLTATNTCAAVSGGAGIANCLYHTVPTFCSICNEGLYFSNGQCVPATPVTNCLYYTISNECYQCQPRFSLDNKRCVSVSYSNCQFLAEDYTCWACLDGYYPSTGACITVDIRVTNCLQYVSETQCSLCQTGYYLQGNVCMELTIGVPNCRIYSSLTTCLFCVENFFLANGACQRVTTPIANCLYYGAAGICVQCQTGSLLGPGGLACLVNCEVAGNGRCLRCIPEYYPSEGGCSAVTGPIANCAYYSGTNTCLYCNPTFLVNYVTNTCQAYPSLPSTFCRWGQAGLCLVCLPNYRLSVLNGVSACVPATPIRGCLFVSADGLGCDICDLGYFQKTYQGTCMPLPTKKDCYCYAGDTYSIPF